MIKYFVVLFISLRQVYCIMKRTRSQNTMCLQCFTPVPAGWQMVHHKRSCTGKLDANNFTQSSASQPCHTEDRYNLEENDSLQRTEELGLEEQAMSLEEQVGNLPVADPAILPAAQPAMVACRPWLSLKTKEIISFLETAEWGEGCSREHAQRWLDREHVKGGPAARLLPRDIRTCWKHVAKVSFLCIFYGIF